MLCSLIFYAVRSILQTQMIVVVMPTCREDKYAAVKKFACIECPVPSQASPISFNGGGVDAPHFRCVADFIAVSDFVDRRQID